MAAAFECMNVLINDDDHDNNQVTDRLFVNKPVAKGYNVVKNPDYENLNLEKDGFIKYFGEDCVEWILNEMLEIEGYMKKNFKKELQFIFDTILESFVRKTSWLREKEFKLNDVKETPVVRDQCHLTGKFRSIAHINCSLNTRKAQTSFLPKFFHNFSGYDCHLIFVNIVNMVTEKNILKMRLISLVNHQKSLNLLK